MKKLLKIVCAISLFCVINLTVQASDKIGIAHVDAVIVNGKNLTDDVWTVSQVRVALGQPKGKLLGWRDPECGSRFDEGFTEFYAPFALALEADNEKRTIAEMQFKGHTNAMIINGFRIDSKTSKNTFYQK